MELGYYKRQCSKNILQQCHNLYEYTTSIKLLVKDMIKYSENCLSVAQHLGADKLNLPLLSCNTLRVITLNYTFACQR